MSEEKVIVNYFVNGTLFAELWTLDKLWAYMASALKFGFDPLDLMCVQQNQYALGRAEVYGMRKERIAKYGRND